MSRLCRFALTLTFFITRLCYSPNKIRYVEVELLCLQHRLFGRLKISLILNIIIEFFNRDCKFELSHSGNYRVHLGLSRSLDKSITNRSFHFQSGIVHDLLSQDYSVAGVNLYVSSTRLSTMDKNLVVIRFGSKFSFS